jgi:type IV pilus assembly protein PilN
VIRVNLLPIEERVAQAHPSLQMPKRSFWLPLVVSIAIIVPLAGIGLMQRFKIASLKADVAQAQIETRQLQPQIDKVRALEKERAEVNQRLLSVTGLARDRYLPVQMMDELAAHTPENLWFTKFSNKSSGELSLEGMTFSNVLVADLMTRMEEADIFDRVALTVSERKMIGDNKVVSFTLTSRIRP